MKSTDAPPSPAQPAEADAARAAEVIEEPKLTGIFLAFLKLGPTAFGGPAMAAYIRELAVVKNKWLTEQCFKDGVALCQSIPGATAMQTAAYAGLRARGFRGALAAYAGFGLPAFLLMILFSVLYQRGTNIQAVVSIFKGLQVIVIAIMANATIAFAQSSIKLRKDVLLAIASAAALGFGAHPAAVIGAAALAGIVFYWRSEKDADASATGERESCPGGARPALILLLLGVCIGAALFIFQRRLFDLAELMAKVDILAFGGGFASVPLMLQDVVESRKWLDTKTFMDSIALGQVTPGPLAITATFVGCQVAGLAGAVVGTLFIFGPSFILVILTAPYLERLKHSRLFRAALRGPLISFVGLLLFATVRLGMAIPWNVTAAAFGLLALAALRLRVDILWVVLAGGAASAILYY